MLIPVTSPRLITDFKVGEMFYDMAAAVPQLHMVCAGDGDTASARYVAALPPEKGEADTRIYEVEEFKGQAALPVCIAGAFCDPIAVQTNSGNGVPKPTALAFADGSGCWMPIKEKWLNLSTGVLSEHRPSAPWVELGNLELRAADGEPIIFWAVFG